MRLAAANMRATRLAGLAAWLSMALGPLPATAVDDGITDYVTIPAGSYLIDTGSLAPTVGNAMRPYGLVFDLVRNQKVPVLWAINPAKTKDGVDFSNPNTGKDYRASAFIVRASFVTPAVVSVINNWRAQGVIVDGPITGDIPNVPIYDSITGIANIVSDLQNGKIAEAFMTRAGVPATAYRRDSPESLDACDDMFIMPHADPTWSSHRNLLPFVQSRGYIWSGCHAVSVLEDIDDPGTPTVNPDMNFLSTTGLVDFGDHDDGSPPYTSILPGEPVMQFIGVTDDAQQGGSEQIYLPKKGGSWRPGARLYVTDPTTPGDVPANSDGPAAAIVMGRAFDVSTYGRVMYEGGHDVGGTAPANIAAQRAFLNFWLLALIDRSPDVAIQGGGITAVNEAGSISLSGFIDHPFPITSYQWTSSGGGSFSAPNSPTTTFTPPEVSGDTSLVLRLTVSDGCSRQAFDAYQVTVINVAKADLAISKTDSADPVAVGAGFSYTLAVSNLGTEPAANVVVEDVLPAEVTFVGASGDGWTCGYDAPTRTLTCTRPTLALTAGTPSNITVNLTAPATPGSVTNTATVSSDTPDFATGNNSDTESTAFLEGIDVTIAKTPPGGTTYAGQSFGYTLDVANVGVLAATNLTVNDILPASLTYVSASGTGWSCAYQAVDRRVSCFRASLAAGASAPITLTVTPSGSAGEQISNTATVSSPDFEDENPADNSSTAVVTLAAGADLALNKTGSTTGGGGSSQVDTYVVTLTNNGPGTATGVVVTDIMSGPGVAKYNQNPWACTLTPSTGTVSPASPWTIAQVQAGGTWSIASLASGASATLTITCAGDNNDGVLNRARVSSTSFDPNGANNSAHVYLVDDAIKFADIELVKTASPEPVQAGGTITYRIRLNNLGTQDANDPHTVVDTLPPGVTYVGFTNFPDGGNWNCTPSGSTVTCTTTSDLKKLTGSPNTLFFDLTVTAPTTAGSVTNTASSFYAWGNDEYDPPDNNVDSVTTTVVFPSSDVAVAKSVDDTNPDVGENVTFTVTATNNGPVAVSNLRVQDLLPAGLQFVSASASQGSYDRASGVWYVGSLGVGVSRTLTLVAKLTSPAGQTNEACVYSLDQTDSNASNDCGSAAIAAQSADLQMTKSVDDPTPDIGSQVTFTVTATNLGPNPTTGMLILDQLPENLTYVSHTASAGSFDPEAGLWSLSDPLAAGATEALNLVATVGVAATPLTNTARITASDVPDPDPSNNEASVTVTGLASDIEVFKSVDNTSPAALNTPLTFTITAVNFGPSDATNVVVTDLLPAGLAYQSHSVSQGSYDPGNGEWTLGSFANGATATLTLVATNTAFGAIVNTVEVTASDPVDPGETTNQSSVTILSGGATDLSLTKTVDKQSTFQGDNLTFTLRIENFGPDPASGVIVEDLLPAGLTYVSSIATQGAYNSSTGEWTVGALPADGEAALEITVLADAAGKWTNSTSVAALDQADRDPTNDSATVVIDVSPAADLSVTKTGPGSATLGSIVTYTLVARNNGPADVSGARLTDSVPAQITDTSWTCVASGSADCDTLAAGTGAAGSGNGISLLNVDIPAGIGNFITVTVTGSADTTGTATNIVVLSPPADGSVFDPAVGNNSDSVTTVISNRRLTGWVFADIGTGAGGVANDGLRNGEEPGIASVAVRLTDCASTVLASATTNGDGQYGFAIPEGLAAGTTLCVEEVDRTGYVSTGGQPGDTGGTYDRSLDRVEFVLAADAANEGVDFGDVPENRFLNDGAQTAQPGSTVSYPHRFVAGTVGQVTFVTTSAPSPDVTGWTDVLYRDADCDAALDTAVDSLLDAPVTVDAGEQVCLLLQQFVPAGLPAGASNLVTIEAQFDYTNASPGLSASYRRQDLTTTSDSALRLLKEVRNVTQGGAWSLSNAAEPGELLEYRITYSNAGSTDIAELVIHDITPAFTTFVAAVCGTPLPAALTACDRLAPAVGETGAVKWQFTGSLRPGLSGVVLYQVQVD